MFNPRMEHISAIYYKYRQLYLCNACKHLTVLYSEYTAMQQCGARQIFMFIKILFVFL